MRADYSSGLVACSPINMAGSSLLTLNELQEQLDKFNRLAAEELSKRADCNGGLVALYQKERDSLLAQIDRQTPGEVQHLGSALC